MINIKRQLLPILITPMLLITITCKSMNPQQHNNLRIDLIGKIQIYYFPNISLVGYATQENCKTTNNFFGREVLKITDLCIPIELIIRNNAIANENSPKAFFNWMKISLPKNLFQRIQYVCDNFFINNQDQKKLIDAANASLETLKERPLPMPLLPIHMIIGNSKIEMPDLFDFLHLHLTFDQHDLLSHQIGDEYKPLLFVQTPFDWYPFVDNYLQGQLDQEHIPNVEMLLSCLIQHAFNHFKALEKTGLLSPNPLYNEEFESPTQCCLLLDKNLIIAYESNSLIHHKKIGGLNNIRDKTITTLSNSHNKTNLIFLLQQRSTGKTQLNPNLLAYPHQ